MRHSVAIVGGGAAGLAAAYTLKQRGIEAVLLEADDHVGGRLRSEQVDGFSIDTGADFFCSSYDVTFRICEGLGVPLVRSEMKLGWYRHGRWVTTTPGPSVRNLIRNVPAARALGFLSPRAMLSTSKLLWGIRRQSEYLSFAGDSPLAELDDDEAFGDYLARIGAPEDLQVTLKGFLRMTMGDVERSGQAYMRSYLAEMLVKADKLHAPERGTGAVADALGDACSDSVHVSTPARRVETQNTIATGVVVDGATIEADAVICAVPAPQVPKLIPNLSASARETLENVTYSTGCRVVIGLERPPLPPGWYGALYPEDDTPLLLDRSTNLPACVPPGKSTLDLLAGKDRARELIPLDDEAIKRAMLRDARRNPPPGSALPDDDEGLFFRVYRWKEAVCMGSPGMFRAVADLRRGIRRELPNLFLAGDYTRVPSVNGALASGIGAAEEAIEYLQYHPTP